MPSKLAITLAACATAIGTNRYYSIPLLSRSGLSIDSFTFSVYFVSWYTWKCLVYPRYFSSLRDLPCPPTASWIGGNAYQMILEPFGVSLRAWVNNVPNDGVIRLLDLFNQEFLVPVGPAALAEVLVHKCYDFEKPHHFRLGALRILGNGILVAEEDVHKNQRKNLMPAFTFRAVKNYYPMFWEKSKDLVQALIVDQSSKTKSFEESSDVELEVNGWVSKAALDIVGVSGLDKDFRALKDPNAEMSTIYRRFFSPTRFGIMLDVLSLLLPQWLIELIPLQRNRDIRRTFEIIEEDVHSQVSAHSQKSRVTQDTSTDIVSVALNSGHFTEAEIVEQLKTFLVAGHETTATAFTWAIYLLCKNPEMQVRLRDELSAASIPKGTDRNSTVTATAIDSLPYLAAVCNETLRLYPPVAATARKAARDTTIINHPVPKGTAILLAPWAINTSTAMWGPDAAEFKPERWLQPGKANSGGAESNYAFLTFLHGPRSCIGQGFAKAEFMCMLAAWVGSFETRLSRPDEELRMDDSGGISVKPRGGLWVNVRPWGKD